MTTYYARPLTTKELIRRYLCGANPVGTWIETSVRKLAAAVGRSEGQMSYHLKALEADGWITKASDHQSTLIEVLRSDLDGDSAHDRAPARSCPSDAPNGDHADARPGDDQPHDRAGVVRNHDSCMQQQHARESDSAFPPDVPVVNSAVWGELCLGTPGYTAAQFAADFRALIGRGYEPPNAIAIIVDARSKGDPIYTSDQITARAQAYRAAVAPEEEHHAEPHPARSAAAPRRAAGSGRGPAYQSATERRRASPYSYDQQPKAKPGDLAGLPKVQLPPSMRVSGYRTPGYVGG